MYASTMSHTHTHPFIFMDIGLLGDLSYVGLLCDTHTHVHVHAHAHTHTYTHTHIHRHIHTYKIFMIQDFQEIHRMQASTMTNIHIPGISNPYNKFLLEGPNEKHTYGAFTFFAHAIFMDKRFLGDLSYVGLHCDTRVSSHILLMSFRQRDLMKNTHTRAFTSF